ncbi:Protein of unknown function, partial [Gryllus bimaculatus]
MIVSRNPKGTMDGYQGKTEKIYLMNRMNKWKGNYRDNTVTTQHVFAQEVAITTGIRKEDAGCVV